MGSAASVRVNICKEWMDAFSSMRLTGNEIDKLSNVFNHVDFNGSGSIDSAELLAFLDIERTSLSKRIFASFDEDNNGHINLYEFVLSAWKLLTMEQKSIRKKFCVLIMLTMV